MPSIRKHGGMWFFRWGRFGGSVYLSRRREVPDYRNPDSMMNALIVTLIGIATWGILS